MIQPLHIIVTFLALLAAVPRSGAEPVVVDDFSDLSAWSAIMADGVALSIVPAQGRDGQAMRLDFSFEKGSGYCIARRAVAIDLPENYRLSFDVRAEPGTPANNLEFKLIDPSGDNVWWNNRRAYEAPSSWATLSHKPRHISFAWGPASPEKPLTRLGYIEFAIAAAPGGGGKGSILIDNLVFEPLPTPSGDPPPPPTIVASSSQAPIPQKLDGAVPLNWRADANDQSPSLMLDFEAARELGGLTIDWGDAPASPNYSVQSSANGRQWSTLYTVTGALGGVHHIPLPETDARFLRIALAAPLHEGPALRTIAVRDLAFAQTPNAFVASVAAQSPRGHYPRWATGEQSYWTAIGADGHPSESLLNEDGQLETDKLSFSVEPFIFDHAARRLLTWSDTVRTTHTLLEGYLPIPTVVREHDGVTLTVTAFVPGDADRSWTESRYRVTNTADGPRRFTLFLAARPFQVLNPWQDLNITGGSARLRSIRIADGGLVVNENQAVVAHPAPTAAGVTTFARADIVRFLAEGRLPSDRRIADDRAMASGAMAFEFELEPGQHKDIRLASTFKGPLGTPPDLDGDESEERRVAVQWRETLNRVTFELPPQAQPYLDAYRSTLAYILINRDGPAIQPGSRTYERTWIRDGSLTSTALHYAGHSKAARELIDWYAPYQYDNGKIPCVVDGRGPDPVPEHDSHGQYIYAVATADHFHRDDASLRHHWPHVQNAVAYIQSLRAQRLVEPYLSGPPEERAKRGLVPESISHEGYSAKPMHSYWDNFFTLRGLSDAIHIAERLGESDLAARYTGLRDAFAADLDASLRLAMQTKGIDYLPGCVELGDYDPTSTSAALFPGHMLHTLPQPALERTFERYWGWFADRAEGRRTWKDYTPYEIRNATTYLVLGQPERTFALLDFFLADQRPQGWNAWAEIVWQDPRAPRFIGDIPHTWVGSDYIKCFRHLFAYEREHDRALVVGAGVPRDWIETPPGVTVTGMPTYWGTLNLGITGDDSTTRITISGLRQPPPGGLLLQVTLPRPPVEVSGAELNQTTGELRINDTEATITIRHGG